MGRRPAYPAICLSAATAFSFLLAAPAMAQQHHWTVHNLEAQKFMQYGNRSAAERVCKPRQSESGHIHSNFRSRLDTVYGVLGTGGNCFSSKLNQDLISLELDAL